MVTITMKIIISSLAGDTCLKDVWKVKDVWFWAEIASDADRMFSWEGWPRVVGERWESPWGYLVERQAQGWKEAQQQNGHGLMQEEGWASSASCMLWLPPFSVPLLVWNMKEPIRWLCGLQWLSERGPLHHAWPHCPGLLPICEEESLGGKLTCCSESDNRIQQNWSHISEDPRELGWGQGLLQMMKRIL